jgi:Alpha/beta hydrolase domain
MIQLFTGRAGRVRTRLIGALNGGNCVHLGAKLFATTAVVLGLSTLALPATAQSGSDRLKASHPAPSAAIPTVSEPTVGSGPDKMFANYPLSKVGYSASEFFFSGTAHAYTSASPLGSDGKWTVQPASSAPYTSRLIVAMPTNPKKFNGTVVVEWLNVSGGADLAGDWWYGHDEMIRSGDAYVGVSAQAVGVNAAKTADPARYGSLSHPGDSFSYDIYSQAAMAVREHASTVLPGLKPRLFFGDGLSQSAGYMTTYVDAIAPLVNVFDGYLLHSRIGGSGPLSQPPELDIGTPQILFVRDDLAVPVLTLQSETDVLVLGFLASTQPDSKMFRLWEVAGAAHGDSYLALNALDDDTTRSADLAGFASMTSPASRSTSGPLQCSAGFNTGQLHYVYNTALHDLIAWARTGATPPRAPRLEVDTSTAPPTYKLDKNGNVLGGIRTPAVDAPLATLSGLPPAVVPSVFCADFGQTQPFTPTKLAALYPTHAAFVSQWQKAVTRDEKAGYLLAPDARRLVDVVTPNGGR